MKSLVFVLALLSWSAFSATTGITFPHGGEMLMVGQSQTLAFAGKNYKSIDVSLSRDDGKTWEALGTINNKVKNRFLRNKYVWTVSGEFSSHCLVRMKCMYGGVKKPKYVTYTSGVFSINSPDSLVGPAGSDGSDGSDGSNGLNGLQGAPGIAGIQGPKGEQGDTGPQGLMGLTGPQGIAGIQGLKGDDGSMGPPGEQGIQGLQGIQGPKGAVGDTGPQGDLGPTGLQGIKGDTGATGPAGAQGVKGDTGATGAQGPQGVAGPQGLKGDTGATGPQGVKGDTGAAGATGPTGPNGSPTVSFIVTASLATQTVTYDGSKHNADFVYTDTNIRGPSNVKGRSCIFLQFATSGTGAGIVSTSYSSLQDGSVHIYISSQNYAINAQTDGIDIMIINQQ